MSLQQYLKSNMGIFYYELPQGFVLYRGDSDPNYNTEMVFGLTDTEKFFGFDQETTEGQYGITFKFQTLKPLKLLALDKNNTHEFLSLVRSEIGRDFNYYEILDILNNNYGYETGTRDSVSVKDKKLCSFICSKLPDFNGYACDIMLKPKVEGGVFHAEAMICNPKEMLTIGTIVTKGNLSSYRDEWKLRNIGKEMEEQRIASKKQRPSGFFDDDDDNSSSVRKSLFGGKRKTKRNQKKTKRNKKKTTRRRKRQPK